MNLSNVVMKLSITNRQQQEKCKNVLRMLYMEVILTRFTKEFIQIENKKCY